MDVQTQVCGSCHVGKALHEFKAQREGYSKSCKSCLAKKKKVYQEKTKNKENVPQPPIPESDAGRAERTSEDRDTNEDASAYVDLSEISLEQFISILREQEHVTSVTARVNVASICGSSRRETSDRLAEMIWREMKYRFIYQSRYDHKRAPTTRFMYHCSQHADRQHKPKKTLAMENQRDKIQMDSFDCRGWLFITVSDGLDDAIVRLQHDEDHTPYWCIDVPDEVKSFVRSNVAMRPSQIWDMVLKKFGPSGSYSQKAIYAIWSEISSKRWKRDDDQVKSARILIEEAAQRRTAPDVKERLYEVEPIPLPQHTFDGFTALSWSLAPVLRQWGGQIREIALDSTWNTNKGKFELFVLIGEIYGSGCPLGYLLIHSEANHAVCEDGKQKYLEAMLEYVRSKWLHRVLTTLTDKDRTEINAFLRKFPDAKHQLCFWHCLRAIKTRLSILCCRPAPYDPNKAHIEYDFIDPTFLPQAQMDPRDIEDLYVAQEAIPRVTVRLGGTLQNTAPERPRIMLRINGEAIRQFREHQSTSTPGAAGFGEGLDGDAAEDGDLDDFINSLDDIETDQEDGPDWMFDAGETTTRDSSYVFCPAPHRRQLLHLFTQHFCQHPMFPRRDGTTRSAEEIQRNAVWEMYSFCVQRGLREVWAYMWNSWYCSTMWKLWARSTTPYVTRLRTTMTAENFFKQLKHEQLHHLLHPRLDHLVYILMYDVTPSYMAKMDLHVQEVRLGRSKPLTPYQTRFKAQWKLLKKKSVRPESLQQYHTDVESWTCRCGHQMFHEHHLCKHLVHAVPDPSPKFWTQLVRRRVMPLYRHPELQNNPDMDDGSITEGDDQIWISDKGILKNRSEWQGVYDKSTVLGKRHHEVGLLTTRSTRQKVNKDATGPSTGTFSDPIELSSSDVEDHDQPTAPMNFEETQIQEEASLRLPQLDNNIDAMLARAAKLEEAAQIIRNQVQHRNPIWFSSMVREDLGKDVDVFVEDVRQFEHGRIRPKTWADAKNKTERRQMSHIMGYNPMEGA